MGGMHVIVDAECTKGLGDAELVSRWLNEAAALAGMKLVGFCSSLMPTPPGVEPAVSAVGLLAESHLSVQTWPEHGIVTMDFYACRAFDAQSILASFERTFGVRRWRLSQVLERFGVPAGAARVGPSSL